MSGLLLDTVAFVRLLTNALPPSTLATFEAAETLGLSAVSFYEINQKVRLGKLDVPMLDKTAIAACTARGIDLHNLSPQILARAGMLDWKVEARDHRDPFDRMIAATGLELGVPVATSDRAFDTLPGGARLRI